MQQRSGDEYDASRDKVIITRVFPGPLDHEDGGSPHGIGHGDVERAFGADVLLQVINEGLNAECIVVITARAVIHHAGK